MSNFFVHFFQNKSRRFWWVSKSRKRDSKKNISTSPHPTWQNSRVACLPLTLRVRFARRKKKSNGTGGLPQCSGWNASDSIVCGTGSLLLNLTKMLLQMQKHFYSLTAGALFCSQTSNFNVSWVNANGAWMELASTRLCLERSLVGSLSYFPSCLPSRTPMRTFLLPWVEPSIFFFKISSCPKIFRYIPKVTKEALPKQGKPGGFSHVGIGWKCSRPCRSHLAPHTGSAVPEDVG